MLEKLLEKMPDCKYCKNKATYEAFSYSDQRWIYLCNVHYETMGYKKENRGNKLNKKKTYMERLLQAEGKI